MINKYRHTMNYKTVLSHLDDATYSIIENRTDLILKNLPLYDAKPLAKHLNFGGGFDGWTPQFFVRNLKIAA